MNGLVDWVSHVLVQRNFDGTLDVSMLADRKSMTVSKILSLRRKVTMSSEILLASAETVVLGSQVMDLTAQILSVSVVITSVLKSEGLNLDILTSVASLPTVSALAFAVR